MPVGGHGWGSLHNLPLSVLLLPHHPAIPLLSGSTEIPHFLLSTQERFPKNPSPVQSPMSEQLPLPTHPSLSLLTYSSQIQVHARLILFVLFLLGIIYFNAPVHLQLMLPVQKPQLLFQGLSRESFSCCWLTFWVPSPS